MSTFTSEQDRYITRMDYDRTRGYWVRVGQVNNPKKEQRSFPDLACGGKRKSLKAARQYRDQAVKRVFNGRRYKILHSCDRRNKTGVIGVCRVRAKRYYINYNDELMGPYQLDDYIGSAQVNRKTVKKSYAVKKYGKANAFRLACWFRKQMMQY